MGRQRLQGGVFLLALISVIAAQLADAAPRAGGRPVAGGTAPGGGGSKAPPGGSTPKPQNTPKNAPKYSSKTVLVQLKAAPAVAAAAAAAGKGPILQGLQFVSMIGEHQGVKLPAGGGPAVAAAAVAKAPANAVMKFKITDGSSVKVKLKQLKANPAVARAQPEYIYSPTDFAMRSPNDPMYGPGDYSSGQWYLPHVWAPSAWATTTGSSSIRVCMLPLGKLPHILVFHIYSVRLTMCNLDLAIGCPSIPMPAGGGSSPALPRHARVCRVPGCHAQLERGFHWKYRTCRFHVQVPSITLEDGGAPQRFCQQCAKFHPLDVFKGERHSCSASLARHQERRKRKQARPAAAVRILDMQGSKRKRIFQAKEGQPEKQERRRPGQQPAGAKRQRGASQHRPAAQLPPAKGGWQGPMRQAHKRDTALKKPPSAGQRGQHNQAPQQPAQQSADKEGQEQALPSAAATLLRLGEQPAALPQPLPQPVCGGRGDARPQRAAAASSGRCASITCLAPEADSVHFAPSAAPCSVHWQAPRECEVPAAAEGAAPARSPDSIVPPAALATTQQAASGRSSTAGWSDSASLQAGIEALLRFEEPLLQEPCSVQHASSHAPLSWQQAASARGPAGFSSTPALQPSGGSIQWVPVASYAAPSAQPVLQAASFVHHQPASSSMYEDAWAPQFAACQQQQLVLQRQQQAARCAAAAWGGSFAATAPVTLRPAPAAAAPAGSCTGSGHVQVNAPQPGRCLPSVVTTGSNVQWWNTAWWQHAAES